MAIELPGPVADFLGFIGITWPRVNEDKVREFGEHVDRFAQELKSAHDGATSTISQLGSAYQGESYERLLAAWAELSQTHMTELLDGCAVLSAGCSAGADAIVGMKLEAIAQLTVMAAEFIADQAAAIATFGLAEAALVLIEEEGAQVVRFLEQELINYIIGQILDAAATPLIDKVAQAVSGMVYRGVADALGGSGSGSAGAAIAIEPDEVRGYSRALRAHADAVAGSAQSFAATVEAMSFE